MPENRDDAAIVATYLQGQVFELNSLPIVASGSRPMHPVAKEAARTRTGTSPIFFVPVKVLSGQVMLVTQTCDLQARRTERGQSLAHVAPIVELADDTLRNAQRDMRPNYVAVPWLGETWFADMDQMAPVDRGAWPPRSSAQRHLKATGGTSRIGSGVTFPRPALPDEVLRALQPLQRVADSSHEATKRVLAAVPQIRVFATPSYNEAPPWSLRVTLLVGEEWSTDAEPTSFRDTGKQLPDITTPMVELFDSAEPAAAGQLATLWGRFCSHLHERLLKDLEKRSSGMVRDIIVDFQVSLTPAEIDESDVLDFGHYSLDD